MSGTQGYEASVSLIKKVFAQHTPEKIGISFNAGKDSVLVVELLLDTVGREVLEKCPIFFFVEKEAEFEELTAFRREYMSLRLPGKKMLEFPAEDGLCAGLWRVKREIAIDVVFMGTRQDDPNGKYQFSDLAPTTEGWPPMLRACPLFYWTYSEVWKYTLHHHIPYCKLYDYGYTSIGSPSSTRPNDSLLLPDGTYGQAWTLVEHDRERSGRFVAGGD